MQITMDNFADTSIKWDANFWWEVYIPTMSAPFNDWIPAENVTEGLINFKVGEARYVMSTMTYPLEEDNYHRMSVTIYDNAERVVENWLYDWIRKEILPTVDEGYANVTTSLLKKVARNVQIAKYTSKGELVAMSDYMTIPAQTNYDWQGDNKSGQIRTVKIDLIIVGGKIKRYMDGSGGGSSSPSSVSASAVAQNIKQAVGGTVSQFQNRVAQQLGNLF